MDDKHVKDMTLRISGRSYPVKVDPEDEDHIHQMEKQINDKILFYKQEFKDIDHQDALTMTLLTFAFDLNKLKQQNANFSKIGQKLESLESIIDQAS